MKQQNLLKSLQNETTCKLKPNDKSKETKKVERLQKCNVNDNKYTKSKLSTRFRHKNKSSSKTREHTLRNFNNKLGASSKPEPKITSTVKRNRLNTKEKILKKDGQQKVLKRNIHITSGVKATEGKENAIILSSHCQNKCNTNLKKCKMISPFSKYAQRRLILFHQYTKRRTKQKDQSQNSVLNSSLKSSIPVRKSIPNIPKELSSFTRKASNHKTGSQAYLINISGIQKEKTTDPIIKTRAIQVLPKLQHVNHTPVFCKNAFNKGNRIENLTKESKKLRQSTGYEKKVKEDDSKKIIFISSTKANLETAQPRVKETGKSVNKRLTTRGKEIKNIFQQNSKILVGVGCSNKSEMFRKSFENPTISSKLKRYGRNNSPVLENITNEKVCKNGNTANNIKLRVSEVRTKPSVFKSLTCLPLIKSTLPSNTKHTRKITGHISNGCIASSLAKITKCPVLNKKSSALRTNMGNHYQQDWYVVHENEEESAINNRCYCYPRNYTHYYKLLKEYLNGLEKYSYHSPALKQSPKKSGSILQHRIHL